MHEARVALGITPPAPARSATRAVDLGADIARILGAERPVVLAGAGVVVEDCIDGLRSVAARARVGVLNTWAAKGVFHWQSPHHLGTAGLQARDFELAGLADTDLIVATGMAEGEVPPEAWQLAPFVEVAPGHLHRLAEVWNRSAGDIPPVALREALAAAVQPRWGSNASPLPPARVTRLYADVLGEGGVIAADPGVGGFWLARTFATSRPRSVVLPTRADAAGFGVAAVTAARERDPHRPALAVVDDTTDAVEEMLTLARVRGIPVPLQVWSETGDVDDIDEYERRLAACIDDDAATVLRPAIDFADTADLVAIAGEITVWRD